MSRRIIQQLASHLDGSGFYRQLPIVYLDQYSGGVGRGCSGAAIASLISSLTSSHCPGSSRPGTSQAPALTRGPAHEDGIMVARSRGRGSLLAGGHGRGREEAHWRPGYWVPALWWHLQDWWPSPALAAPPRDSPRAPRRAAACHWSALRRHGPPAASSAAVIGWLVSAGRDSGWLLSTHPHDSSSLRPAELQPIYFLFLNEQVCVIWVQADTSLACGCGSEQTTG